MTICAIASFVLMAAAAPAPAECVYPNELPGLQVCATAPWRSLRPLESTAADVRRVLGTPTRERDIAHYVDPYPGDAKAEAPVLAFDGGPDWEILVYLVKSDARSRQSLTEAVHDRLLSIDLIPKGRRSFAQMTIPDFFRKRHIVAADAAWNEYADGSGLVYQVYTTRTRYGDDQPGDLNRISYGASDELKSKYGKR